MKKVIFPLLVFLSSSLLSTCYSVQKKADDNFPSMPKICKQLTWNEVKILLSTNSDTAQALDNVYSYISSCQIRSDEVNELINIYQSASNNEIRLRILSALKSNNNLIQKNKKIVDLYKSALATEDRPLVPVAIEVLAKNSQVNEVINIYNLHKKDNFRKAILKAINEANESPDIIKNSKLLLSLYKSVAASKNHSLAPVALKGLINTEGNNKWTDWSWSDEVTQILKESVNNDFYKLSLLTYYELLALANKYPDSQFTKACKEYRDFTEGAYFAQDIRGWGSDKKAVLRQPFNPPREIEFWPNFLKKYPEHPGSDDAMYRLARAYELQGNYETAILWYYQASQAPDGGMNSVAKDRLLFIVDGLVNSDFLSTFLNKNSTHALVPYLIYSRAIHLIREDKLTMAQSELEKFLMNYSTSINQNYLTDYREETEYISSDFNENVKHQLDLVNELRKIQDKNRNAESLYEEASFWFHNQFIAYNHLWRIGFWDAFSRFVPDKWEGVITATRRTVNYEIVKKANQGYELQNRHLKSIRLLQKLLRDYPDHELAAKAKYSIALNYYYLEGGKAPTLSDQKTSWGDLALKSYNDFFQNYPNNSMADDALLVIAELGTENVAVQALTKLLNNYPNGDRYKEAEAQLNKLNENRSKAPSPSISASPVVGVGIKMEKLQKGNGVLLAETVPNSPARQAGLQPGDIIVQVDGQAVASPDDVKSIIRRHQPGETVRFEIERQGQRLVVGVVTVLISL